MDDTLRTLVDMRDRTLQKSRIAFSNRLSAIERGDDNADDRAREIIERWHERFLMLEKEADEDIKELTTEYPIIEYMTDVKGLGHLLAAKVAAMVDIERADTISALWRYAGYGVMDGERERPVKGERLHYNKRLKTACYLVGSSFLKSNSPYRKEYDAARVFYEANRDWTKGHQHNAAMRKMVKLWLSHLWVYWRSIEGLPVTDPYVHDRMGHNTYKSPTEYGWREL